ncbi:MAG: preprotein translocase subunit SecE [Mycoplasmatales bacterium]
MGLKKITWPDSKEVLKHFAISLTGMIFLILFFAVVDLCLSELLTNFYK